MVDDRAVEADGHQALPPPTGSYRLTVVQVTSFLVVTFRKPRTATGGRADLEALHRKVQLHNVLFGWWGIPFGIIWTIQALGSNRRALEKLRSLVAAGAVGPGWHPDPTGRHAVRFWDGQRWTDQVSDVRTDPATLEQAPRPASGLAGGGAGG